MNPGTDWIDSARRLLETLRPTPGDAAPAGEAHSADCRWCPVCQVTAVVRGERPEVTGGRLVDPGTPEARLVVGFRPDPQLWPADLLAAEGRTP